ncbi:hypothetical protein [Couchioplanes caeruleus]|uniref:Uncharacterized protein n=2 Tax=Couchioplanes caeruleus TaxID=56438 RepID=A0A1K0GNC5_9ACTN|nr:hypothetical protein [Couchioplanes caeruleus]OJF13862.1 hypothetical protein BG844_12940 [Couchioplanes caeruleus subsp. caeruleus]ROP34157.1 hypothetical protein EDD30_7231 [Couchioplanes caeruleus]
MSDTAPEAEPGSEDLPEPFANRAARRAKGKKTGSAPVSNEGRRPIRTGTVQNPRQYGNRRSG